MTTDHASRVLSHLFMRGHPWEDFILKLLDPLDKFIPLPTRYLRGAIILELSFKTPHTASSFCDVRTRTMFERIGGIETLFNVPYLSLDLLPLVESK
jgi:hypothetical protein